MGPFRSGGVHRLVRGEQVEGVVPVAGVIIVGEHGHYPDDPKTKQTLYPRRRLFDEVVNAFRALGRRVPVFCDKHFSYDWLFARWMVDVARHEDSRSCIALLGAILDTPGLVDRLLQVLRPAAGNGRKAI